MLVKNPAVFLILYTGMIKNDMSRRKFISGSAALAGIAMFYHPLLATVPA